MWWSWLACTDPPPPVDTADSAHAALPGHNDCLPEGEAMSLETCRAVVEADGRVPTTSYLSSGAPAPTDDDPRLSDPDYVWLTDSARRCTCSCCHSTLAGGPGVHRWDIDFAPVWIDSANDWVLTVFVGDTDEYPQTLPSEDPDRVRAVIEREFARREQF